MKQLVKRSTSVEHLILNLYMCAQLLPDRCPYVIAGPFYVLITFVTFSYHSNMDNI